MSVGKGKSQLDLARDEYFRREVKQRKALSGPFRCPKCHMDLALFCQVDTKDVEQPHINYLGEEKTILIPRTTYLLTCRSCGFVRITKSFGQPSVIDEYNRIYDEELSERSVEELRRHLSIPQYGIMQLRECKVSMR